MDGTTARAVPRPAAGTDGGGSRLVRGSGDPAHPARHPPFAGIAATVIQRDLRESEAYALCCGRIEAVLNGEGLTMVYRPIVELEGHRVVGFESLARFAAPPARTPDLWFEEAERVGLGGQLEVRAIERALACGQLGAGVYVVCIASPGLVLRGALPASLGAVDLSRGVLEITEHANVADFAKLHAALRPLARV